MILSRSLIWSGNVFKACSSGNCERRNKREISNEHQSLIFLKNVPKIFLEMPTHGKSRPAQTAPLLLNKLFVNKIKCNSNGINDKLVRKNSFTKARKMRPSSLDTICCLLYTSPSPRDGLLSRMPSSA